MCLSIRFSGLPDDDSESEPPDPIPNSVVKRLSADGSVGFPHVRVGHRQAFITQGPSFDGPCRLCRLRGLHGRIPNFNCFCNPRARWHDNASDDDGSRPEERRRTWMLAAVPLQS